MSKQTIKWVLKRKIMVYVGDGEYGSDFIKELKNKELYDSREAAQEQSNTDQATLLSAMRGNKENNPENNGIVSIGGLIFDVDDVKCAKFDVRPAADWELSQLTGESGEDTPDPCDKAEEGAGIPGAQCVNDDEDE